MLTPLNFRNRKRVLPNVLSIILKTKLKIYFLLSTNIFGHPDSDTHKNIKSIQKVSFFIHEKLIVSGTVYAINKFMNRGDNLLLHGAELHPDDELALAGHALEHVSLETTQEMGAQHVVQFTHLVVLGDVRKLVLEVGQVAATHNIA